MASASKTNQTAAAADNNRPKLAHETTCYTAADCQKSLKVKQQSMPETTSAKGVLVLTLQTAQLQFFSRFEVPSRVCWRVEQNEVHSTLTDIRVWVSQRWNELDSSMGLKILEGVLDRTELSYTLSNSPAWPKTLEAKTMLCILSYICSLMMFLSFA
eukprot:3017517-Amphidinium_carterae.2